MCLSDEAQFFQLLDSFFLLSPPSFSARLVLVLRSVLLVSVLSPHSSSCFSPRGCCLCVPGQPEKALALVDESISHTPTPPDSYMLKARIYKHAGDPVTAYGFMDVARRLDTQDRYLNVKCVRYALRADELKKAESTVLLFIRDGDGLKALEDLQAMWYENAAAELHLRAKSYGKALKKLVAINKHFVDIMEDQFDFHSYCLRKSTLRAYVDMIRWGNTMRGHKYHVRAAFNLVRTYLRIFDAPREASEHFESMALESNLNEEQRKEEAKRLKKAAAKARAAEEKQAAAEAAAKLAAMPKGKQPKPGEEDPDPDGALLAAVADPLAEASKYFAHLANLHSSALATHTLGVALFVRKARFLLALKHLQKALAIDAAHPDTHAALCAFLVAVRAPGVTEGLHPIVREFITTATATEQFGAGAPVAQLNSTYLSKHAASLPARLAVARTLLVLDPLANKAEATTLASQIDPAQSFSRQDATESLSFLVDSVRASPEVVEAFKARALKRFPFAVAFGAKPAPPPAIDAQQSKE